ncbi:MFS transporter [Enterococcus plantarum]|uniref:MFS transporter n=1 Tax=Enterococcus plantarum TaxID=1077675 RepID=A0A2W4BGX4_9ENTE|nr:MFS transporter [Enterococcus plantarum]MBO0424085.1 MFS transporter [Enterococcus plantarum]PZL71389.1 MFS transporter [Enterococcus plantarum]
MEATKKNYTPLIGSLYTNFIFQGMAAIILSQNLNALMDSWQATVQQVTLVISGIGLGRVLILYFAGYFSDKFGRKKTVQLGIISYLIFFLGILVSQNYVQGLFFALFAGFSNAFLDTSTYPTLMEAYPNEKDNSSLSVLNKAFISLGQFILPLLTRFMLNHEIYYGLVFIGCALGLFLNLLYISKLGFPERAEIEANIPQIIKEEVNTKGKQPLFKVEGLALLVFSFTCVSTFNIFILWVPSFAESLNLMNHSNSLVLVSAYSIGSFASVFLTSLIVKRGVAPTLLLVWCTTISLFLLLGMTLFPSTPMFLIGSIGIGIFAAGGIWQLGLAVLLELFSKGKGRITSYYSIATSVSVMVIPYITGQLEKINVSLIFWLNIALTAVGVVAAIIIRYRYKKVMNESQDAIALKEITQ